MTLPTIRARLSRALLLALLGWGTLVVLLVGMVTRLAVDALLDDALHESTELLYALVQPLARDTEGPIQIMPRSPHEERVAWQVFSGDGRMQARSETSPAEPLAPLGHEGFSDRVAADGTAWRVYSITVDADGSMLHVGQRASDRGQQLWQVLVVSLGATLLAGLLTSVWLGRRVRRELAPLVALSDAVRHHDPMQGPELPAATREELQPLRAAVMALGRRLSLLVKRERVFTAHVAHTLRTPLAGMDAQLAAAIQESPPQGLPRLRLARNALTRLNHVIVALLHLFRSDRDLQPRVIDLTAMLARWPFGEMALTVDSQAVLQADPELLTAALLNLLDNAQRHGASHVAINVRAIGADVLLQIRDDGRGIDAERLAALQRAIDQQDSSGPLGLGLTLAGLVARAHGGRLRLSSDAEGTCVEMRLSTRPSPPAR